MIKKTKSKKKKTSFFTQVTEFEGDYWIVNCPKCEMRGLFEAFLSNKKDRLYLRCNFCGTIFISPPKKVRKQK